MTKAARFGSLLIALTVVCGLAVATASAGIAKRGDVRVAGVCTGSSASKLKLSEEDGRIEVEFEVDQNRSGIRWMVVLNQSGRLIARVTRTTRPPSGSFEARMLAPDKGGRDVFAVRATRASGEVCTARATFS